MPMKLYSFQLNPWLTQVILLCLLIAFSENLHDFKKSVSSHVQKTSHDG